MGVLQNVTIPSQGTSSNLCWAAVTIGVCASLGDPRRSLRDVATKFLADCQGDLSTDVCNQTFDLDRAIKGYGHQVAEMGGQLDLDSLLHQLDELRRPVPVIMSYPFTNHACLIKGCVKVDGTQHVVLLNPSDAVPSDKYFDFDMFRDGCAMDAQWIDSYLVS